jgi:transcriptional regulator with XRE-family HTH domain
MIGRVIKKRRTELNISLSELAKRLSDRGYVVQRQTVNHWESGRNNAPIESEKFREALASSLELDANEMLHNMGFAIAESERSHDALYLAELADRLPDDGRELLIDYAQLLEERYLKKTALMS